MFPTLTLGALLLLTPAVRCEIATYGNLSTNAYAVPKTFLTSSASSTRGLGEYILAALGATSSVSTNTSSSPSYVNTAGAVPNTFTNSSNPTYDVSIHGWFAARPSKTTSSYSHVPSQSTICFSNAPSVCYSDITYSGISVEPTGSGSAYASRCSSAQVSYSSASSSWGEVHSSVVTDTNIIGGTTWKSITYYKDAYTLCDGHARVAKSPAIPTSTTVETIVGPATTSFYNASVGWIFPVATPACSINPSDCDPLWSAYDSSSAQWIAQGTDSSHYPLITASPMPPPCANASAREAQSSAEAILTGCGPCTIFGVGVQLVYFPVPTTVSRDMCASTPVSPITWFDEDLVSIYTDSDATQTVYPPLETATYNNHTFTSGTAYISISSVWIGNRCSPSMGTPVTDAILAMPSESVLSLRYRQDHFQYFYEIKTVSGYPFNFADLNEPVPYSAYQGQQMCEYQDSQACDIIYDNNFNPQLAMPPGIRKLRPEWEQCQMWYGGLYDPPMALQPATALATATLPGAAAKTSAEPSPTVQASTASPTALYQTADDGTEPTVGTTATQESSASATALYDTGDDVSSYAAESLTNQESSLSTSRNDQASAVTMDSSTPFTTIAGVAIGVDPSQTDAVTFAGQTLVPGGADTFVGGTKLSKATNGLVVDGDTMAPAYSAHVEQSQSELMVATPAAQQQSEAAKYTSAAADTSQSSVTSVASSRASSQTTARTTSKTTDSAESATQDTASATTTSSANPTYTMASGLYVSLALSFFFFFFSCTQSMF